jgi:hypothetical protein
VLATGYRSWAVVAPALLKIEPLKRAILKFQNLLIGEPYLGQN